MKCKICGYSISAKQRAIGQNHARCYEDKLKEKAISRKTKRQKLIIEGRGKKKAKSQKAKLYRAIYG